MSTLAQIERMTDAYMLRIEAQTIFGHWSIPRHELRAEALRRGLVNVTEDPRHQQAECTIRQCLNQHLRVNLDAV